MESQAHIDLVKRVFEYSKRIVPKNTTDLIQVDSDGKHCGFRTSNNYIPDIFYEFDGLMIIGEAKTLDDFERKHSFSQYEDYIETCKYYSGKSVLVIGVPWQLVVKAKNYFKLIKRRERVEIDVVIVNELGKEYKV